MFKKLLLALAFAFALAAPAQAQNPTCPTRPFGDNSNACASTAFVQTALGSLNLVVGGTTISGGANTRVLFDNAGVLGEYTITGTGSVIMNADPTFNLTAGITYKYSGTTVGTESIGNPAATTPANSYVTTWQGSSASATTSLHVLPAGGALTTATITEIVTGTTAAQAFGGNYGRWSLTNQGTGLSNASGLFGEFGGTTATGAMGPFIIQVGVENPAATFKTYEFVRFQTTDGGSEDANIGASLFGVNQPVPGTQQNRIVLIKPSIGSAGTRDSDALLWEGKANNGTERAVWWRQFINVTSNAGASTFKLQQNLNGGGYTDMLTVTDTGILTSTVGTFARVVVTGNTVPSNGLYLPAANTPGIAANSLDVMRFPTTASAVNWIEATGAAAGGNTLGFTAAGSDTNINFFINPKGSGFAQFGLGLRAMNSGLNGLIVTAGASGTGATIQSADTGGSGNANIDLLLQTTGTGQVKSNKAIVSTAATSGIGYATGAGVAGTQSTNKSTTVTNFTSVTGTITMNGAALAAATIVTFGITGAANAATDQWIATHESVGTLGGYTINCRSTGAGTASCDVRNNTAGSLSEAIVLRVSILKSVNS